MDLSVWEVCFSLAPDELVSSEPKVHSEEASPQKRPHPPLMPTPEALALPSPPAPLP